MYSSIRHLMVIISVLTSTLRGFAGDKEVMVIARCSQ